MVVHDHKFHFCHPASMDSVLDVLPPYHSAWPQAPQSNHEEGCFQGYERDLEGFVLATQNGKKEWRANRFVLFPLEDGDKVYELLVERYPSHTMVGWFKSTRDKETITGDSSSISQMSRFLTQT